MTPWPGRAWSIPMLDPVLWPLTGAVNGLLLTAWLGTVLLGTFVRALWWLARHTILRA